MSWRFRILGLSLMLTGCVSQRAQLLESIQPPQASDLEERETPRVSRMQRPEPSASPVSIGRPVPPPVRPVGGLEPRAESASLLSGAGTQVKVRAWVNGKPIFDEDVYAIIYPALQQLQNMPEPERSKSRPTFSN